MPDRWNIILYRLPERELGKIDIFFLLFLLIILFAIKIIYPTIKTRIGFNIIKTINHSHFYKKKSSSLLKLIIKKVISKLV